MLLTHHTLLNVSIAELYYGDRHDLLTIHDDVIIAYQNIDVIEGATPFLTSHIDLHRSYDSLFTSCDRQVRQEVRRSEDKDAIAVEINTNPDNKSIALFRDFYNRFAVSRQLPKCRHLQLQLLAQCDGLTLTSAYDDSGSLLVAHAYVTDGKRARALYSASHFRDEANNAQRALCGRANRLLHWKDIGHFKERGYEVYDVGGIGDTNKNPALAGINQFKKKFGGVQVIEYNTIKTRTYSGRLALLLQQFKAKCRAGLLS